MKKARLRELQSNRQLPILPARHQASTFGLWMLNYCVRYGNRWNHPGIITGYVKELFCSLKTIQKNETTFQVSAILDKLQTY